MNDIPIYWTCPRCGNEHKAHLNIDEHLMCQEIDCWWRGPLDDSVIYESAYGDLKSLAKLKIDILIEAAA
jgi:hypothetical protein